MCYDAAKSSENTSAHPKRPIKIGVASMVTPADVVKYYQEIIDYLGEQINQPVHVVQSDLPRMLQLKGGMSHLYGTYKEA